MRATRQNKTTTKRREETTCHDDKKIIIRSASTRHSIVMTTYPEYSWDRGLNPPPPALPAPPAPPINAPAPRDVRRDIREWEEWSNDPKNWLPGEAELRKRARLMPGDRYPDRE
eukprot:tig00022075_g23565.t1